MAAVTISKRREGIRHRPTSSTASTSPSPTASSACWSGPPGCGKSTLLRMIAGLEEITAGEIAIGGTRGQPRAAEGARHRDGVPELRALSAHDRARQHGVRADARQAAEGGDRGARAEGRRHPRPRAYLDRYPRQLSGGQRQRVAMGRAIVRDPQVFLFDEPLSNLDAKLRVQMRTEIKELHQRLKTTTIYVTHDQIEAMTMADQHRRHARRHRRADRRPARALRPPGQHVRRRLHRLAGDEHDPRHGAQTARHAASSSATASTLPLPAGARARRTGRRCSSACGPSTCALGEARLAGAGAVVEPTGADTQVFAASAGSKSRRCSRDRADFPSGRPHHARARSAARPSVRCATGSRLVA